MKSIYGIAAALALLLAGAGAAAQARYPERTVRILVGFAPAGPADIAARLVADKLGQSWGKPVVVENVPGAAGNIATERAAKAPPDGHTLIMATSANLIFPSLFKLAFDPIKDLAPISQVCVAPNMLVVHNEVPARSVAELVALARARPGMLTFGSGGVGTTQHLAGELFKSMAALDLRHVPYRGIAAALPDLLAGRLDLAFGNISAVLPLVREGRLRALAVTSPQRWAASPDLPTMAESGFPGFDATAWFGLMAPAPTPAAILAQLHGEIVRIVALPDIRKKFDDVGMAVIGNTPAEFAREIALQTPKWAKVIEQAGLKASE